MKIRVHVHAFEERKSMLVWLKGRPILIVKDKDKFYGMDAVCAHMGCAILSEVDGTTAICPAHGAKYNVITGEMIEKPLVKPEIQCEQEEIKIPLKTYAVNVGPDGLLEIK
jgi:Ferredoxin subunits of nitrite reductase and ring-hydroxylating dioxygenases